jgi:hypothetical protein
MGTFLLLIDSVRPDRAVYCSSEKTAPDRLDSSLCKFLGTTLVRLTLRRILPCSTLPGQ